MYCLISFVTAYVLELVLIPFAWKLKENVLWGSVVGTTMIVACVLIHENNWQFIRYDMKRARPKHLLREHNLLFRSHRKQPVPLSGKQLEERREALWRHNRGTSQCRREVLRATEASARPLDDDGGWVAPAPTAE